MKKVKRRKMKQLKKKKIRVPPPKQSCKVQDTDKKIYNRKKFRVELN
jgi:hypothetical protein